MYIYPCKTKGKCRQQLFEKAGLEWRDAYPKFGRVNVWIDSKYGFQKSMGNYKCCTQCHLPIDQAESMLANRLYGYTIDDIYKPDDEFLELLNGF